MNSKHYTETVKAVKCTCGHDREINKLLIPSSIKKLTCEFIGLSKPTFERSIFNIKQLVRKASEFQNVQEKWNNLIQLLY